MRYRVADAFLYAANCHCSRCPAATGSAFKPFAGIERDKLESPRAGRRLIVGDDDERHALRPVRLAALLGRARRRVRARRAGSLVDAPTIRPSEHIFVGSKAPWFEITDDLPQFEEHAT